jgi:hypothetical protein
MRPSEDILPWHVASGAPNEYSTKADRGENMAHTRAADDFQAIRARMEELRREREDAAVSETDC